MNTIKVMPLGDFNYQTFPIDENQCYEITEQQLQQLNEHKLKWSFNGEKTVEVDDEEKPIYEDEKLIGYKKKQITIPIPVLIPCDEVFVNPFEIAELKQKLSLTDYIVVKLAEAMVEGDMDLVANIKSTYAEELANRAIWRARINELEAALK